MAGTEFLVARSIDELNQFMSLVPRGPTCVKCDDQSKLQCPSCNDGESCQYTIPIDCSQCPSSYCAKDPLLPSDGGDGGGGDNGGQGGGRGGTSAGPIAGGVIGGIIVISIITYLVWRFLIKPKRSAASLATFEPEDGAYDVEKDGASRMNRRLSTHTVHSIASTVLTRASNIIQIAYIPGVTNRTTPSPNNLAPPVPPIPMQHSAGGQMNQDQHFFVPGNLRDSTYSGISEYSDRTSYARTSFAPRSSIASTIYGKQAQVLAPAQTGMRAKPTVVSVKNGSNIGSSPNTPPMPSIDFEKYLRPESSASTFSVGSTFLNSANTATPARAQVVKLPASGLRKVELLSHPEANASSTTLGGRGGSGGGSGSGSGSGAKTADSPSSPNQGPFSDPQTGSRPTSAAEGTPEDDVHAGKTKSQRGSSPFGDEHATRD